jgi:hypothetical protein
MQACSPRTLPHRRRPEHERRVESRFLPEQPSHLEQSLDLAATEREPLELEAIFAPS